MNKNKLVFNIVVVTALVQLALSQVYISAVMSVFNSIIGIVFFGFIISSLVAVFNAFSFRSGQKIKSMIFSLSLTIILGLGFIYILFTDYLNELNVTFDKIASGFIFGTICVVIFIFALLIILKNYKELSIDDE